MDNPGIIKRAGTFLIASTKHIADGFAGVPDEVANERMRICKECENFENPDNPTCKVCSCYLNIKTTWASEACPIKKWLEYQRKKVGSFSVVPKPSTPIGNVFISPHQGCGGCGGS